MSDQFDIFDDLDEIAQQFSPAGNVGTKKPRRRGRGKYMMVSAALARAKVARPAPDSPAAAVSPPEAIPEKTRPAPGRIVRTKAELIAVLRDRKEALNLSHETMDRLVGWADRMSTKALVPVPRRGLSGAMLQAVLDALGLGVAAVVIVEDPEQADKMRSRWPARGNSGPRPNRSALLSTGDMSHPLLAFENATTETTSVAIGDDGHPSGAGDEGADQIRCSKGAPEGR
ncbi:MULTISPECIES: hypothetical protein [unclassified Bradyrhizobium]|uniref:hypothetical protein n=1 Tax=unclassified Bradyrhizobium TaxID=2631580 RepID=UPI002478C396|nr:MULTISPECIES: hypothetical protein [unclassified Bradyrhizobium]WGS23371.1 hypothetical protein MTX22_18150 [Bradyrhizobium sp. ISRA463]WGS30384.1 hypothetical protein MTX19_15875 [Bradyrhizobium sp. ISRA464]